MPPLGGGMEIDKKMAILISIDGLDGSGKSTQLELLFENLKAKGIDCRTVSFPDYDNPSSTSFAMSSILRASPLNEQGIVSQPENFAVKTAAFRHLSRYSVSLS